MITGKYSRTMSRLLVGTAGVTLAGCSHLGAMSRVDPITIAVYPGGESRRDPQPESGSCTSLRGVGSFSRGAIDLDCFVFPEDVRRPGVTDTPTVGQLAYRRAAAGQAERNRLTALLLKHSDDICVEEMGRLNSNEATVNTSLSVLGTGATTAANIVTGELAQQILTGIGTFAGATRSHFNSYVYRNTFPHAISRAIALERQRLRGLLEARYTQPITTFTVDEAIQAANEYHGVCSFYKGIELVLASVEGDQRSRDALLRQTQVDAIDQEIRRQLDAMERAPEANKQSYRDSIAALNTRRSNLVLAGIPSPPSPSPPGPPPPPTPPAPPSSPPGDDPRTWRYEGSDAMGVAPPNSPPWPTPHR